MEYELYHHGILGQKWGKRNGPPYPLGPSDHSKSEQKAGWKKSLSNSSKVDNNSHSSYNSNTSKEKHHLTDNQKKALKIGAAVVGTALVTAGAVYAVKSGKAEKLITAAKPKVAAALNSIGNTSIGGQSVSIPSIKLGRDPSEIDMDFVRKINPGYESDVPGTDINCFHCSTAYILKSLFGIDSSALPFSGVDELSGAKFPGRSKDLFHAIFRDLNEIKCSSSESFSSAALKIPKSSTGVLFVRHRWGFGHFVNYERDASGILTVIDCQSGKIIPEANYDQIFSSIGSIFDFSNATIRDNADGILQIIVKR